MLVFSCSNCAVLTAVSYEKLKEFVTLFSSNFFFVSPQPHALFFFFFIQTYFFFLNVLSLSYICKSFPSFAFPQSRFLYFVTLEPTTHTITMKITVTVYCIIYIDASTDKKERKIFLICKEIQKGSGKVILYMRKGFLIYEGIFSYIQYIGR